MTGAGRQTESVVRNCMRETLLYKDETSTTHVNKNDGLCLHPTMHARVGARDVCIAYVFPLHIKKKKKK